MSVDTYTPQHPDSLAMHKLRRMVALSATFQARAELTYAELWERCHYRLCLSEEAMPFYVIDLNSGEDQLYAGGDMNYLLPKGSLFLAIQVGPHSSLPGTNDRRLEALDFFSGVRQDVSDLAGVDDEDSEDGTSHICIHENNLVGIEETPPEHVATVGLRYLGFYSITWSNGDA